MAENASSCFLVYHSWLKPPIHGNITKGIRRSASGKNSEILKKLEDESRWWMELFGDCR
jgi:hypothetical protein